MRMAKSAVQDKRRKYPGIVFPNGHSLLRRVRDIAGSAVIDDAKKFLDLTSRF